MKIGIVGTGCMGSVYAGLLGKAGHEVWAIDIWQAHIDAIASSGLTVTGASGNYVVDNLHVGRSPADAGSCDLWLIVTKASQVDKVAADIAPLLEPESIVMPFQNGLGAGERVARRIPEEQIVIGIAEGFGSSIPQPGHVHHEGMRLIRIGEMHGGMTERVQRIEHAWRDAGFNVRAFADVDADDLGEVPLQRDVERTVCRLRRHGGRVDVESRSLGGRSRLYRRRPTDSASPKGSSSRSTTLCST